jgi:hypothetical protein
LREENKCADRRVIRVYDAGNVIETHEHAGDFKGLDGRCSKLIEVGIDSDLWLTEASKLQTRLGLQAPTPPLPGQMSARLSLSPRVRKRI